MLTHQQIHSSVSLKPARAWWDWPSFSFSAPQTVKWSITSFCQTYLPSAPSFVFHYSLISEEYYWQNVLYWCFTSNCKPRLGFNTVCIIVSFLCLHFFHPSKCIICPLYHYGKICWRCSTAWSVLWSLKSDPVNTYPREMQPPSMLGL